MEQGVPTVIQQVACRLPSLLPLPQATICGMGLIAAFPILQSLLYQENHAYLRIRMPDLWPSI